MRILKRTMLNDYAKKHSEIEEALKTWFWEVSQKNWKTPKDLLAYFPKAKILERNFSGQNAVYFELKPNSYYLVAIIHYPTQCILLKGIISSPELNASFLTFKETPLEVKPIRTDEDYERALEIVEDIWPAEEGSAEYDHFEVLAALIENYEQKHWSVDFPDPISALKFHMNQQDKNPEDLGALLGSTFLASKVLCYEEALTLSMINRICSVWKIPAECLIKPYHITTTIQIF